MKYLQTLVFVVLQLALLPFSIAGYVYAAIKSVRYAKATGASATATSILGGRWIMHAFGVRDDFATVALLRHLPFVSPVAYKLLLVPGLIAHKLTGYVPSMAKPIPPEQASISHLVNCRTPIFDRLLEQVQAEIEQVVVMGAGYDTRLMKFRDQLDAQCFELDQASTQDVKRKAYTDAGLDVGWIHFVPVDFTHESWSEKLLENGFDPSKKTFWLWEGVTLYLDESIVRETLIEMDRLSATGSRIAFDFYSLAFVNFEGSAFIRSAAKQMLKTAGESLKFGVDTQNDARSNITKLLAGTNLSVAELTLLGRDQTNAFAGIVDVVKS